MEGVLGEHRQGFDGEGGHRNTHFLGTILKALGKGGVRGRTSLGARAEMDRVVGELAVKDAHVALRFAAVVWHSHREAVGGHLCLDSLVWHGGNGNCDSSI